MKKFLLLFTILCTGILANAAEITFDMTDPTSIGGEVPASDRSYPASLSSGTVKISVDFNSASGIQRLCFYKSGSKIDYRCSAGGGQKSQKLTFSTTDGSNITKIEFTASDLKLTVSPGTLTEKVWEGDAADVTFTTTDKCVITKIVVTTANGGTPVEPVAPSELTVKYGETSVSDNDEVSVTEGTEFNISAKDAAKIIVTDLEDNVLASADANKLTWTPEVMAENLITVTASNEKGEKSTFFSLTVTEKPFTAIDAIDILTVKSFNLSGNQYGEHTATVGNSTYKAYVNSNTASGSTIAANQIIGMRVNSSKGDGGIVTVESSGYAVKVCATQWENQSAKDPVYLKVYGQDIPYTNCKNVSSSKWGEELGEIALEKGVEKSLMLAKGYKYIAIMPKSGTIQLSEIKIQWASEKPILPEGGLDFTIDDTAFEIEADAVSAEIIVTGVHAESDLYYKFTATPAETAPESAPRKVADHAGYTKAERNSEGNHAISVSEAGTLELYAYHPATDSKSDVKTITVTKQSDTTAIDAIGADTAEGEAEYFNLQGVRINPENAAPGLYIRRQGGKAAKVLVKK